MKKGRVTSEELAVVTQNVWSTLLSLDVSPVALERGNLPTLTTGVIEIHGAFTGAVTLEMPYRLAQIATSMVLKRATNSVTQEDVDDVLGEMTNILGGNIKAMLPEPSRLSLPMILQAPVAELLSRAGVIAVTYTAMTTLNEPIIITLAEGVQIDLPRRPSAAPPRR